MDCRLYLLALTESLRTIWIALLLLWPARFVCRSQGHQYCGDPGVPANGYRRGDRFETGYSVTFGCNEGFVLNGSGNLTCVYVALSSGAVHWDSEPPRCVLPLLRSGKFIAALRCKATAKKIWPSILSHRAGRGLCYKLQQSSKTSSFCSTRTSSPGVPIGIQVLARLQTVRREIDPQMCRKDMARPCVAVQTPSTETWALYYVLPNKPHTMEIALMCCILML